MIASVLYWMLRRLVELLAVRRRSEDRNAVEILVLRHELTVLRRQAARPRCTLADRVVLGALARALPRDHWGSLFVRPETIRRWHAALVRRRWTYQRATTGRPQKLADDPLIAQRGFSRAMRRISSRVSASTGGRPACRYRDRQRRRAISRCQLSNVAGVTSRRSRQSREMTLASAEITARSAQSRRARPAVRRSTASSWRRITISASRAKSPRRDTRIRSTAQKAR
jgi:hypothetical protein